MYCDKCGEKVDDLTKVCPTCGLYISNNLDNNFNGINDGDVVNTHSNMGKFINIVIVTSVVLVFGFLVGVVIFDSSSYNVEYSGSNYSLAYSSSVWTMSDLSDSDYLYLRYNNDSSVYLQIPNEAVEINLNVNDLEEREMLYAVFLNVFDSTSNLAFTNVMAEIKPLDNSNYYYLSADYSQYAEDGYNGKAYFLHTANGKTLAIMLVLNDGNIISVEDDVFSLFRDIEM